MSMIAMAVLRHSISIIGVWLADNGYADGSSLEAISGALMTIGSLAWSIIEKKGRV